MNIRPNPHNNGAGDAVRTLRSSGDQIEAPETVAHIARVLTGTCRDGSCLTRAKQLQKGATG
jgi:hypothetical protein